MRCHWNRLAAGRNRNNFRLDTLHLGLNLMHQRENNSTCGEKEAKKKIKFYEQRHIAHGMYVVEVKFLPTKN